MRNFLQFLLLFLAYSHIQAQSFEFALIGDMPYHPDDSIKFERLIDDVNQDTEIQWVLHTGDIKSGGSLCSDEYFQGRLDVYNRFKHPFILTPGDNDWTDCHREACGGFSPLDRLIKLREIFYANPGMTLGQHPMSVSSQSEQRKYSAFVENQQWERSDVYFAAIHIVGSLNGLVPFDARSKKNDKEVSKRTEAAIAWMKETFEDAQTDGKAVFLMIHANPGIERRKDSVVERAFGKFLDALERLSVEFGRPVVLAHGDSHYFRYDKPLIHAKSRRRIENFTRLENFGDRDIHWVRVMVDPNDPNVFQIRQELIPENFEQHGK